MSEIDAIRALLTAKPRPVGWSERRARIDEIGATWPVAPDVQLEEVECDSVPGEWSIVPGSDTTRVLLFFHGGGYCSGSIVSHRRMVTEAGRAARMRTLAVRYRRYAGSARRCVRPQVRPGMDARARADSRPRACARRRRARPP